MRWDRAAGVTDQGRRLPDPKTDATHRQLRVDGRTREYLLHRPTAPGGRTRPLVIAFHGRGSTASYLREQSRLDEDARARGMLIAYPEGLGKLWGAGTRATGRRPDPDLDVRFTKALIAELVRTERADPKRVYVVGFSNGGSMALRVAAQSPELLAGAAAVSGELPTGDAAVKPTGPVPLMIIYGAADRVRPLAGMPHPSPAPAGEEPVTPTMSARDSAAARSRPRAGRPPRPRRRPKRVTTAPCGVSRPPERPSSSSSCTTRGMPGRARASSRRRASGPPAPR
ncbi:alpha/beta hydrolase family esterase [Streptomyces endophytica]|uniref:Alpha/beta fold hydrolase n=1 Tax=Streptomyces endophytica TaxID=2991496 RepID=A0ABY6PG52_9ACTN|nr:alpha/beta fold hydrolase [Streptomyces endophytica]UZJ32764.1 alpha/beta fold hydrolase [Streptomyces endophytica]